VALAFAAKCPHNNLGLVQSRSCYGPGLGSQDFLGASGCIFPLPCNTYFSKVSNWIILPLFLSIILVNMPLF